MSSFLAPNTLPPSASYHSTSSLCVAVTSLPFQVGVGDGAKADDSKKLNIFFSLLLSYLRLLWLPLVELFLHGVHCVDMFLQRLLNISTTHTAP